MTSIASANISKLADALRRSGQEADATTQGVLVQSSGFILAEMEARVPVRSGNLRASLGVKVHPRSVVIGPDEVKAPYAKYVEFGTAPHEIKAKPGNTLSFMVGGKRVYAKTVHHPGTRAQPFVRPSFEAWVQTLGENVAAANVKVIKDAASA